MTLTLRFAIPLLLLGMTSQAYAENYNLARSIEVQIISMDDELARRVIPVVRTYVSAVGHIAHLAGSNQLILADYSGSLAKLKTILSELELETFDPDQLARTISGTLIERKRTNMRNHQITLSNLEPKVVAAALSGLVSQGGHLTAVSANQIEIRDFADYAKELERMIRQLDAVI
jgi:hypothetical protein